MNYIIIFDNTQLQFNVNEIHRFITTSNEVKDWWHYLPNVYIIETNMTAKKMADSMLSNYKGLRFFITKIDLADYNGVLSENAWTWIKRKTSQVFSLNPVKIPPSPSLVDLLRNTSNSSAPKVDLLRDLIGPYKK